MIVHRTDRRGTRAKEIFSYGLRTDGSITPSDLLFSTSQEGAGVTPDVAIFIANVPFYSCVTLGVFMCIGRFLCVCTMLREPGFNGAISVP